MSTGQFTGLVAICLSLLCGCQAEVAVNEGQNSAPTTPAEPVSMVSSTPAIAWFDGDVDAAFDAAAELGKPVFLYFGAEWCPYCKELQATIFKRERFVALSRQFVPIDLGGDSEDNIQYGDRFNVYGLPTVIVFSPRGEEITRIAGGLDMEQYAGVLELALNEVRPVRDLVLAVQSGAAVSDDDWRLLGAYSWGQDKGQALGEQEAQAVLRELAAKCPARLSGPRSRLQLAALELWLDDDTRDRSLADGYLTSLNTLLDDEALLQENLVAVASGGALMVTTLASAGQQPLLQEKLLARYAAAADEKRLDVLIRAYLLRGWAETATALPGDREKLTPAEVAWITEHTDAAIDQLSPYQQHAGLNTLWQVYYALGMEREARATLMEGIEVSRAPYYFMSSLAYLEREAGNTQAALDWYRNAWDATTGPTTRARWGLGYVTRLVAMAPQDIDGIGQSSRQLMAELATQRDWLQNYQRGFARLSDVLLAWSGEANDAERARRLEVITSLQQQMNGYCAQADEGARELNTCTSFLSDQAGRSA